MFVESIVREITKRPGIVGALDAQSVTDTLTMSSTSGTVQVLTPTAARVVLLPPEVDCRGVTYTFRNASPAYALTIKEDSNTTTVQVLPGGFACELYCDGSAWYVVSLTRADGLAGALSVPAVDMAGAAHALITSGTADAGQTLITSWIVTVDANGTGGGSSGQTLTLPAAATNANRLIVVANTGGETVTLNDAAQTELADMDVGLFVNNGAAWVGGRLTKGALPE